MYDLILGIYYSCQSKVLRHVIAKIFKYLYNPVTHVRLWLFRFNFQPVLGLTMPGLYPLFQLYPQVCNLFFQLHVHVVQVIQLVINLLQFYFSFSFLLDA